MIADLEALLAKATPGPWEHDPTQGEGTVVAHETPIGRYVVCDAGTAEEGELIAASHNALPAILTALRAAEALLKAQSAMGGILVCANPKHLPLRHPLCNRCQIDARFEELEDTLAALGECPREGA